MPRKKLPPGIYKRGNVYYCCFTASGTQVRKRLSTDLEVSKVMLRKLRMRHEAGEADNEYPLDDLVERFFRAKRDYSPKTIERYRRAIASVISTMRLRLVSDITPEAVYLHREKQAGKGLSATGTEQEIAILRTVLRWGIRQRIIGSDPIQYVDKVKVEGCEVLPFSQPEADAIIEDARGWRDIFRVAFATGLRRAELSGLNVEDFDLDARVISIPRHLAKTKSSIRTIPILDCVYEYIQGACNGKQPGDGVFLGKTGRRVYKSLWNVLAVACERADIPMQHRDAAGRLISRYGFHSTRHSFATWLRQNRAPREQAEDLLGHKRTAITDRYLTFSVTDLRDAISKHPWGEASQPPGIVPFLSHRQHKQFPVVASWQITMA